MSVLYVHDGFVFKRFHQEVLSLEKKATRVTFRIKRSMLERLKQLRINISNECRSALLYAINREETAPTVRTASGNMWSIHQSAKIYNIHLYPIVRTFPMEIRAEIVQSRTKLPVFERIMRVRSPPQALPHLVSFLEGEDYSEDFLQRAFVS